MGVSRTDQEEGRALITSVQCQIGSEWAWVEVRDRGDRGTQEVLMLRTDRVVSDVVDHEVAS